MTYGNLRSSRRPSLALLGLTLSSLLAPTAASAGWDFSVSGFGGYSLPFKTDIRQKTPVADFTGKDASLESSAAYGGKITAWTTAPRRRWGLDVGAELDITQFSPDIKPQTVSATGQIFNVPITSQALSRSNLTSTIYAVNLLVRKPFLVSKDLPSGRWYPYLGFGLGVQRTTAEARGFKDTDTAFAFQLPVGAKVFITRHIALFGEYKYTRASHTFTTGPQVSNEMTVASNLFLGGLAIHFN